MQYAPFGRTGREVARLGYGAMGLGGAFGSFDEQEGIRSVLTYLERGGNFIDTARHYGQSERILGKALKQWPGEKPFIATKVQSHGPDNTRWAIPPSVETTFPRQLIRQNAEESLRLLGVDCLDCLQLHLYWPNWGVSGYWLDELNALKDEGKIASIGVSLPDHRCDVGIPLVMSGSIDSVQVILNIFDPLALDSLVPICAEYGVAVIARCILDEAGLTGFLTKTTQFEDHDFRKTFFEEVPDEFLERQQHQSIVYLPMGLCEPHGHVAAMGLDTIKADYLCDQAANRFGGIVAPTQGYHIHESGYHAPWLAAVVGDVRPYMTSVPPHVLLYFFLYQLRAFHNANFKTAIVLSGHAGGNEHDLRLATEYFAAISDMTVRVYTDTELVQGHFIGDHAGAYEISQLLHIDPAMVNLSQLGRMHEKDSLGRFAQGEDAQEASAPHGQLILETSLLYLQRVIDTCAMIPATTSRSFLSYEAVEIIWEQLKLYAPNWLTLQRNPDQVEAPSHSLWKDYEDVRPLLIPNSH